MYGVSCHSIFLQPHAGSISQLSHDRAESIPLGAIEETAFGRLTLSGTELAGTERRHTDQTKAFHCYIERCSNPFAMYYKYAAV